MNRLKNHTIILLALVTAFFMLACDEAPEKVYAEKATNAQEKDYSQNILIIAGQGGSSGDLFIKSAETYKRKNGGEIFQVNNGDEFIKAINDYVSKKGRIHHLEYFGHGNNIALFVNQEININGAIYINDPEQDKNYIAASIYELKNDIFASNGTIRINGCNIAKNYEKTDTFAEKLANYFNVPVTAPIGPTEFSSSPDKISPIKESNYSNNYSTNDFFMVPTYQDMGFINIKPGKKISNTFDDIADNQPFSEAVVKLSDKGLNLDFKNKEFRPYLNTTYKEAREFCKIFSGDISKCKVPGYKDNEKIRNLYALKMLIDSAAIKIPNTKPWHQGYISWANKNKLLQDDFVNKKFYTRGEMAMLTYNFINLLNK